MTNKQTYSLGASREEQQRLDEQQQLYGDAKFLHFNEDGIVCEIGCGSGANLWLAKQLKQGKYIGIDNQLEQIKACQQKAKTLGLSNVEFYCANGQHVPLSANYVDAAFCRLVLIHLPDPENVVKEMVRISKPKGQVIAIEPEVSAYHTTKSALMKCFFARVNYIYRAQQGSINIARDLPTFFLQQGLQDVTTIKYEIMVTGKQDKKRLIGLLVNWYKMHLSVAKTLVEKKLITQNDLLQAERELAKIGEQDSVYQCLWITKGRKI